jgi:hypothetical protein
LIEENGVLGVEGMFSYNGFRKAIMKGVNNMIFEMGLDRPTSLANVGFATGTWNLINNLRKKRVKFILSKGFVRFEKSFDILSG